MATTTPKLNKKARRELARKKAKMKKLIIILAIVVVVLAVAAYFVISAIVEAGTDTYSDGDQFVKLRSNGRFVAEIHHDDRYRGTYTIEEQGNWTVIAFNVKGEIVNGMFMEDYLLLPDEWQDDHGHNSALPKQ